MSVTAVSLQRASAKHLLKAPVEVLDRPHRLGRSAHFLPNPTLFSDLRAFRLANRRADQEERLCRPISFSHKTLREMQTSQNRLAQTSIVLCPLFNHTSSTPQMLTTELKTRKWIVDFRCGIYSSISEHVVPHLAP